NDDYERRMSAVLARAVSEGVTHIALGDLFLEEIRAYRVRQLAATGIEPLFPLWCSPSDTSALAREMINGGLKAMLTCVDTKQLSADFAGRAYDRALLADLPPEVDPCGERGEFHTFAYGGPMFTRPISIETGVTLERDDFVFTDLTCRATHNVSSV